MVENIYMSYAIVHILLIVTNIALWVRANGTIRINNVWFQVARKCLNTMSADPVGYVARKFINKFRDMVPQNVFSTVRTGGKRVQLVVISGHDFISYAIWHH